MNKAIIIKGLSLIIISIILGAFAAHLLENKLTIDELNSFQVGVRYQMYGGLLLVLFGTQKYFFSFTKLINLFFIGNITFCVTIYYLALTNKSLLDKIIGPITPLGGLLMIISLILILFKLARQNN